MKVDGSAQFGIDVRVPDMLVGTIAASPVFGGKLKSVDDTPALRVKGVRAVVKLGDAVAVLGEGYWPCKKGLEALSPQWEEGSNANLDSARIATMLNDGFGEEGAVAEIQGDPAAALQKATKTVEAIYPGLRVCRELPTCERPLGRPDDKTGAVAVLYSGQCLGLATHHRAAEGQAALSQGVHFGWPG